MKVHGKPFAKIPLYRGKSLKQRPRILRGQIRVMKPLYWNSHFTNTVAGLFTIYLSKTVWADDEQNSGLVNFRLGMVVQISSICRKTAAKA